VSRLHRKKAGLAGDRLEEVRPWEKGLSPREMEGGRGQPGCVLSPALTCSPVFLPEKKDQK
jgi:hypothetical protein